MRFGGLRIQGRKQVASGIKPPGKALRVPMFSQLWLASQLAVFDALMQENPFANVISLINVM